LEGFLAAQEAERPPNDQGGQRPAAKARAQLLASECSDITPFLRATEPGVLKAVVGNPGFGEREALYLLNRKDLPSTVIEELANQRTVASSHAVKLALTRHPKTPLRTALEQLKFLYLFDLVSVCLQTGVRAEVKRASEELVLAQVPKLAVGQRITLAKRGSARLAASLLKGENLQIIQAVLDNPYLTEAVLLPVLNKPNCSPSIVETIAIHPKWGLRYDIRLALLRHSSLSIARALAILPGLKPQDAKAISQDPAVIPEIRKYLSNRLSGCKSEV
jgi:hypothetical protein